MKKCNLVNILVQVSTGLFFVSVTLLLVLLSTNKFKCTVVA